MNLDAEIKNKLNSFTEGYLGTAEEEFPYVSAVSFIYQTSGGKDIFYLLLSDLAKHTRNLKKNSAVSLLIPFRDAAKSFYETPRLTVQGHLHVVSENQKIQFLREIYPKQVSQAEIFLTLADFRFYALFPSEYHWIGGFGKAKTFHV